MQLASQVRASMRLRPGFLRELLDFWSAVTIGNLDDTLAAHGAIRLEQAAASAHGHTSLPDNQIARIAEQLYSSLEPH